MSDIETAKEPKAESESSAAPQGCRVALYTEGEQEPAVEKDCFPLPRPSDRQMLWVDVDLDGTVDLDRLWGELGAEGVIAPGGDPVGPAVVHQNGVMQLTLTVHGDGPELNPTTVHCVVADNWLATMHRGPLGIVDDFNRPYDGRARIGDLDGPTFLSLVLDWQLNGYFQLIDDLQADIDQLDEQLLLGADDQQEMLKRLHGLRARVRVLRSTLGPHRQVFGPLGHPESDNVLGADIALDYQRLEERLQQALDGLDTARDMIVGSFDIFMTRTAQTTNDIMKRLTVVSVLLLPAVVIAGIMGMNFKVGFFSYSWIFWVVLGLMGALAGLTLWIGKRNKWL